MRLDQYVSKAGGHTRTEASRLIRDGGVAVGGVIVRDPKTQVSYGADIAIEGWPAVLLEYEYYLLHKPAGYLTARTDGTHPVVMDLVPSARADLAPVGRLDLDMEGVLLVTNDGALAHRLLSPKREVPKTYYAEVDRPFPADAAEQLGRPVVFKDFTSRPAVFERLSDTACRLTVTEGKFHEVKRL